MDNSITLDPQHSVIVEACAGSGKTWLLVSRIMRLLLADVRPADILAITFTRKAAQEMQARLHEWLHLLATQPDDEVRDFLAQRGLHEVDDAMLLRARGLYQDFLLAQPAITINTFHGWFMQIIQRAPLNAGVPVGMQLLERTSALREEAWQAFAEQLRAAPESEISQKMQWLFAEYGLHSTHALLKNFVDKRAEWWAYVQDQHDPVAWTIEKISSELGIDLDADPVADACSDASLKSAVYAFAKALATGTPTQCNHAGQIQSAWEIADSHQRFNALLRALFTQAGEPRSFKPTKKQDEETFLLAREVLFEKMQTVRDALTDQAALRMNDAALNCGVALLEHYQQIKLRQQKMDFTDVEWQVCRLLNHSDCAEYMQYKLDSRYRHVLLDEFQDTNPVQWQILQAWFAAAAAVDSQPTVFVVGDPKQSIYRFRRADARLFAEASDWLQQQFGAHYLSHNITRRNAPAVLHVVNGVFSGQTDGLAHFAEHIAHHQDMPGYVGVLPLAVPEAAPPPPVEDGGTSDNLQLRNPLIEPRAEQESGGHELEAEQFAAQVATIVEQWSVQDKDGTVRRAEYRDIMVLVRKRTHLRIYEHALRARHIPFITSRRGGLLDTLEAEDMQALLTFLITPFADLQLAQTLRSPIFSCSDQEMMLLAGQGQGQDRGSRIEELGASWWRRLQHLSDRPPALQRAHDLLQGWLALADKLPVHDLLDRIYFESGLVQRYIAALPHELHQSVRANLEAFIEIALNVDAGRYPSLPRFLAELDELRKAGDNEAPDEGKVGEAGNVLRIYTVHEAKGLEAPIVWLLDTNDIQHKPNSYSVVMDWQPDAAQPAHFSLFSNMKGRGTRRMKYFIADEDYRQREEMNLLYVAMTRARQALLISGSGELQESSWYARIAALAQPQDNPLAYITAEPAAERDVVQRDFDDALQQPIPTGQHAARSTLAQRRGVWLHQLLQHLAPPRLNADKAVLQVLLGIPQQEMEPLWQMALGLLVKPDLQRYFDPQYYRRASNEMAYVNAQGELRRIDRLVEFDDEVWVLDYKISEQLQPVRYRAQMQEYRTAMQAVYSGKRVRCAVLFADGALTELE